MAEHLTKVALATRHQKQQAIGPALERQLGWQLFATDQYDTDQLGTFSGEVERTQSPLQCAQLKAQKACEITGLHLGLGSEGSFGTGPFGGLVPWNQELLTLVDVDKGWQVTGCAQGPSFHDYQLVESEQQLKDFLDCLPAGQRVILYPQSRPHNHIHKGLIAPQQILDAYHQCIQIGDEAIMVEYDLRAMHCPERMERIAQAADDLCQRWQSTCPNCQCPGFWPDKAEPGLPCKLCHLPTKVTAVKIAQCQHCDYEARTAIEALVADPVHCNFCNP